MSRRARREVERPVISLPLQELLVFFLILVTGYIYVWRKGVLDWGHERG